MTADLRAAAQQAFNLLDRLPINEGYHDETVEVLDALRAELAAQSPAEGDVSELPFVLELREHTWVIDWSAKGGDGCQPATPAEVQLWHALAASKAQPKAAEGALPERSADCPKDPAFDSWWDSDRLTQTNPYAEGSPVFWAWEGWQARVDTEPKGTAEPVAWMDDGTKVHNGPGRPVFRVITADTRQNMPASIQAEYTTPLYAHQAQSPAPAPLTDEQKGARWKELLPHSANYTSADWFEAGACFAESAYRAQAPAVAHEPLTSHKAHEIWVQACVDSDVVNEVVRLKHAVPVVTAILNAASKASVQHKEGQP